MRSPTPVVTSRSNSLLHNNSQEEKQLQGAFSLEMASFSQSQGVSVNVITYEVGSLFRRLKHQEDLTQQ